MLPIHPAAAAYPRLDDTALAELAADIKGRGLELDVVLIREGNKEFLLDGISRLTAIEANGVSLIGADGKFDRTLGLRGGCRVRVVADVDPFELAASLNAHRRHLTAEDKRARIEALIKAAPEKSDRVIAKAAKASPTTVGKVRSTVQGGQLKKRTGADGKIRKQPAARTAAAKQAPAPSVATKAAEPAAVTAQAPQEVAPASSPELQRKLARLDELENLERVQATKIIGLENEIKDLKDARRPKLVTEVTAEQWKEGFSDLAGLGGRGKPH